MKYIFDFDDTLCNNKPIKAAIFSDLEKLGVPQNIPEEEYKKVRNDSSPFSLQKFLNYFGNKYNISTEKIQILYQEILRLIPKSLNQELLKLIKSFGRENCFMISNGDEDYQRDKINASGIAPLFSEIHIVPWSKKEIIYKICQEYPNEEITFYDDKEKFFADIDMSKCPNLKTLLYQR